MQALALLSVVPMAAFLLMGLILTWDTWVGGLHLRARLFYRRAYIPLVG